MSKDTLSVLKKLREMHGNPRIELNFSNPLELTVAAILSAQCTDQRVNQVTEQLFRRYRSAKDYTNAEQGELEEQVRPTGFYRNKAKSLKNFASDIESRFGGRVPDDIDLLTSVRGIGRKTANMIIGVAFGRPAMIVETHVMRVAKRVGLTKSDEAEEIEEDLKRIVPQVQWTDFSLLLILHGRYVCVARKPRCLDCLLREDCNYWLSEVQQNSKIVK
ncbi:MAG TPA: endonuclease III [Deltaproteobacteria bacterium]|nr:endonuclease III [Deltaproteobacteria bacterium]